MKMLKLMITSHLNKNELKALAYTVQMFVLELTGKLLNT